MYLITTIEQPVPGTYNTLLEYQASVPSDTLTATTTVFNRHKANTYKRSISFISDEESNTTNIVRQIGWKSAEQACYFHFDKLENLLPTKSSDSYYKVLRAIFVDDPA